MSFSSEQKREITEHIYKSSCCRRALLFGVLFARGKISNGVSISLERPDTAQFVAKLIKEFFSVSVDPSRSPRGGRCVYLNFESNSAEKYIANVQSGVELYKEKCAGCTAAFLRGVFLGAGRVSDPAKQYGLEFSLDDRSEIFASLLTELGVAPLVSNKKTGKVVYYKNSSLIEDFSAIAGMNTTVFAIMNEKITSDIRNNVIRIANCETNNIGKAVNASMKLISTIEALDSANLLSSLPEELEATARLRVKHRDLSLSQLAAISVPAISKSGLSHRLAKINEFAEELLKKN